MDTMNEAQRQSYLQEMGIESYFPRFILPGAAPSPSCPVSAEMFGLDEPDKSPPPEISQQARSGHSTQPFSESDISDSKVASQLSRPLVELGLSNDEPKKSAVATGEVSRVANVTGRSVQCKLTLIQLPGDIVVLNQLPTVGNGQLPPVQQRLLEQIARALGLQSEGRLFDAIHLFQWPMLDIVGVDNSIEAARAALVAFVDAHCQQALSSLILMGGFLSDEVFPDQGAEGSEKSIGAKFNCKVVKTYSLDQLLKMPGLKAELWLALTGLRKQP